MNLDWDFYFDDWLIDKIPDGMKITVEEDSDGILLNPPELTCYFGANPIYVYGKGKLFHEAMISPTGIAIYPEFLNRPGFEFVDEMSFHASFDEDIDYSGENVQDHHVGYVNALTYMNNIARNIYGVEYGSYIEEQTPSSNLRIQTQEDYSLQQDEYKNYQIFTDIADMVANGCSMYLKMGAKQGDIGPYDYISESYLTATAPGALITYPGVYNDIIFLKYTYIDVPQSVADSISGDNFQILFSTVEGFREGVLFDFGSTNVSSGTNYGFRLDISTTGAFITMNDGNLNIYHLAFDVAFRFSHKWSIVKNGSNLWIILDEGLVAMHTDIHAGGIIYEEERSNYISGRSADTLINTDAGDIEEVAFFGDILGEEVLSRSFPW